MSDTPDDDRSVAAIEAAMVRVRRRQTRRVLAAGSPVDPSHVAVLDALEAIDPTEEPTVGRIAEQLGVDQSQGSRLVAGAVAAGLVERVASPADGRRCLVRPTGEGRQAAAAAHRVRQAAFARATADWSPDERERFADLLTRFVDALDAAEPHG